MLKTTEEVDPRILEEEFFAKKFKFSYSGLNRLLYAPQLFYRHYVLKQQEDRLDSHLMEGKVIHCLLLDNGSFNEQFIVSAADLPGDNARLIVNRIFALYEQDKDDKVPLRTLLDQYEKEILAILLEIDLHQSLTDDKTAPKGGVMRTGDQKRIEKIITEQNKSYFEFLKLKGTKDLIDSETLDKCTAAVEILRNHGKVSEILGLKKEHTAKYGIYNERPLEMSIDSEELPFGLKGILDNLTVEVENKIVFINDLKTSGKTIADFAETVQFYNYWMQAAIYKRLAQSFLKDVLTPEWTLIFNFIVIDKYQQVYVFQVSDSSMSEWEEKLDVKLREAAWHFKNRDFSLPYEFAKSQIML